uniref:Putative LOC100115799 [Nasonia vitripennis] n=1 Tax=Lepeophtheirus salmonis TaxID=72036 RepID=A0A0K2TNF0_LEPSM
MMNIINVLKILLLFFHSSHTFENHKLSTQSSFLSKRSGSNLTLHCNSNYEPILCLWKTSYGHVYTLSNGVLAERGRLAHVPWKGCAMEILGVQKRDSGKWECEVGVVIGDDFVTSTENIVLAITDKETNKQVTQSTNTSTNRKSSTSGIREVGDDVIMHCSGTSGVVSLCRWKTPYHSTYIVGQGIYVERGRIQWRGKDPEKDCTIRISSLEMRDAGVWTCEIGFGGNNYNDLIIQTKDYRINIEAPLKLSTPTILTEKDQATLVCHANKEFDTCKWKTPYGSIFTFKDPQSSHENGRLSFYSFRSSKTDCGIMIERVELRDNGDWVCLVEANNNGKIHQKSSEILSLRSKSSDNLLDESINNDYSTDLDYGYSPLDIDAIDYVNGDFDKVSSISSSSISSSPPFHVPFTSLFQKKNPETSTMTVRTSSPTPQTRRSFRRKISTTISSKTLNPNKREPSKPDLLLQRTPKIQQNYRLSNPRLNNPSTTINQIELKKLSTSSHPISTKAPSTSTTDNPSSFPHPFRTTSVIKSISSVYTPDKGRILVSISFKPTDKTNTDPPTVLVNGNPSQESENNQERETAKRKAIQRERERQRRLDKEKEEIRRREEERERELKRQREKQEEDMRNRKAAEDELRRIKKEEEDKLRRKTDEEERRRKAEEERLMILKVEEKEKLRMKKVEEERLRRLKEEEESLRTIKEEQDRLKRIKEEEARFKRIEQDRLKRIKEEEERLKRIKEEQERLKRTKEEEDRQRKVKEEEDRLRRIKEEEERQRRVKEEEYRLKRIKEEEENQRKIKEEELLRRKDQERLLRRRKEQGRQQQRRRKEQAEELRRQKEQELEQEIRRKEQEEALKKQKELEEELERQKKEQEEELKKQKEWEEEQERKKKEEEKQELNRTKELERELQKRRLEQQEEEIRRRKNQELRRRTEIELQKRRHEQERIRKEPDEDLKLSKEEHEREKIIREHERRKKFDRKRLTNLEKERQRYVDQQQQLLKKERRQFEVNRRRKLRRERYKGIKAERRIQIEPTNEPVPSTRSKESTQASIGRKRIVVIDRDEPIGTRQNVQNIDSRRRFYLNEGNTAIRRKKVNLEGERLAPKIIKSVEMSTSVKSTVREEVRQVKEIRHVSKVITISPHHSISHSHSEKSNEPIPKQPMKEVVNPFTIKENIKNLIQSQTLTSTSLPPQTPVKLPNTENDETRRGECLTILNVFQNYI